MNGMTEPEMDELAKTCQLRSLIIKKTQTDVVAQELRQKFTGSIVLDFVRKHYVSEIRDHLQEHPVQCVFSVLFQNRQGLLGVIRQEPLEKKKDVLQTNFQTLAQTVESRPSSVVLREYQKEEQPREQEKKLIVILDSWIGFDVLGLGRGLPCQWTVTRFPLSALF
jgi:hypothetical protein